MGQAISVTAIVGISSGLSYQNLAIKESWRLDFHFFHKQSRPGPQDVLGNPTLLTFQLLLYLVVTLELLPILPKVLLPRVPAVHFRNALPHRNRKMNRRTRLSYE